MDERAELEHLRAVLGGLTLGDIGAVSGSGMSPGSVSSVAAVDTSGSGVQGGTGGMQGNYQGIHGPVVYDSYGNPVVLV